MKARQAKAVPKRKKSESRRQTKIPGSKPTIWTPEIERRFFAELARGMSVTHAATTINMGRGSVHTRRREDPEFAERWDDAVEAGTDALEDACDRRARHGVEEPVFYKGDVCGTVTRYADTLAMFLLKGRRPEKYRERVEQHLTGADGAPLLPPTLIVQSPALDALAKAGKGSK